MRSKKNLKLCAVALFLLTHALLAIVAPRRTTPSPLAIRVKDGSGAVVPGATVTLTPPEGCKCGDCNMNIPCPLCCAPQRETTDPEGVAEFRIVRYATYGVQVEVQGFKTYKTSVTPTPGATQTIEVTLSAGDLTNQVQIRHGCGFGCRIKRLFQKIF